MNYNVNDIIYYNGEQCEVVRTNAMQLKKTKCITVKMLNSNKRIMVFENNFDKLTA